MYTSNASILDRAPGSSVFDMIGRTPLVRLHQFERETPGVELYAKAEWQNPGGSVKDRAAARMILDGEAAGKLTAEKTILDATSGNTGIAYAMVGAARGYKVKLCVPENASPERKLILRALGAELVLTNPLESTDGAIREARRLYAEDPERYFYPDQYNNDANWKAHYDTTAPEIIEQTSGRLTHFVAGLGTSGTFVGTGRRPRRRATRRCGRTASTRARPNAAARCSEPRARSPSSWRWRIRPKKAHGAAFSSPPAITARRSSARPNSASSCLVSIIHIRIIR